MSFLVERDYTADNLSKEYPVTKSNGSKYVTRKSLRQLKLVTELSG
jgi:hypothetical protein